MSRKQSPSKPKRKLLEVTIVGKIRICSDQWYKFSTVDEIVRMIEEYGRAEVTDINLLEVDEAE